MKHTKEPWKLAEFDKAVIENHKSKSIAVMSIEVGMKNRSIHSLNENVIRANAQRIVDCVNACAGINPKAVPDLLEACKYTIEQLKDIKGKAFPIMPILNAIQKADLSIVDKS